MNHFDKDEKLIHSEQKPVNFILSSYSNIEIWNISNLFMSQYFQLFWERLINILRKKKL